MIPPQWEAKKNSLIQKTPHRIVETSKFGSFWLENSLKGIQDKSIAPVSRSVAPPSRSVAPLWGWFWLTLSHTFENLKIGISSHTCPLSIPSFKLRKYPLEGLQKLIIPTSLQKCCAEAKWVEKCTKKCYFLDFSSKLEGEKLTWYHKWNV